MNSSLPPALQNELDGIVNQYREFTHPYPEMILADHFDVEDLACTIERLGVQIQAIQRIAAANPDSAGMSEILKAAAPAMDLEHTYIYGYPHLSFTYVNDGLDAETSRFTFSRSVHDERTGNTYDIPVGESNREAAKRITAIRP